MPREYLDDVRPGDRISASWANKLTVGINRLENRSRVPGKGTIEFGPFWAETLPERCLIRYVELLEDILPPTEGETSSGWSGSMSGNDFIGPGYDAQAVILVWDTSTRSWVRDTDNFVYVARDILENIDAGERLYVWLHQQSGRWLPFPLSGITRLAIAVDDGGGYPDWSTSPDTYAITFVGASYTEQAGDGDPIFAAKSGGPHAFVNNLTPSYVPEGSVLEAVYQQGRWYAEFRDPTDDMNESFAIAYLGAC